MTDKGQTLHTDGILFVITYYDRADKTNHTAAWLKYRILYRGIYDKGTTKETQGIKNSTAQDDPDGNKKI